MKQNSDEQIQTKGVGEALERKLGKRRLRLRAEVRPGGISLLMNQQRFKIYQYLCNFPCMHLREICRALKISLPTAKWHLKKLCDGKFLVCAKPSRRREVYYPAGLIDPQYQDVFAVLNNSDIRRVFAVIYETPDITQHELSERCHIYQQKLAWLLKKLIVSELIIAKKSGKTVRYEPTQKIHDVKSSCSRLWNSFVSNLMMMLEKDCVMPKLVTNDERRIKIQLSRGREKSFLIIEKV